MILRTRQRRQVEKFENIEGQFFLDDLNIAPNAIWRIGVKPEDITGNRNDSIRFPSQQHLSVFGDLILSLLCGRKVIGIDILQSDEDSRHTGSFCFFDEIRDLVTKRIDLDHQSKRNAFVFAQIDQAVEDGFPFPVSREIIVRDKKPIYALRAVQPDYTLDIVC